MTIYTYDIKKNGVKVGSVQATDWIDQVSGTVYKVPLGYNPQNTINNYKAYYVASKTMEATYATDGLSPQDALIATVINDIMNLYSGYKAAAPNDLQRSAPNGASYGGFVEEFTPIASFDFGLGSAAAGLPTEVSLMAGGVYNKLFGNQTQTQGAYYNNPVNVPNIINGSNYYKKIVNSAALSVTQNDIDAISSATSVASGVNVKDTSGKIIYINLTQSSSSISATQIGASIIIEASKFYNNFNVDKVGTFLLGRLDAVSISSTADKCTIDNATIAMLAGANATISGKNDIIKANSAIITLADSTTATINGTGNTINFGSKTIVSIARDSSNVAINDIIRATNLISDLKNDSIIFAGHVIAGNYKSGDCDQYGRHYTLQNGSLIIRAVADVLTINGFKNGDFGANVSSQTYHYNVLRRESSDISWTRFMGISNNGKITGYTSPAKYGSFTKAFIYNGTFIDFTPPATLGNDLMAWHTSNNGYIVGFDTTKNYDSYFYNGTSFTILRGFTAMSVNNLGVMVGFATVNGTRTYGTYKSGVFKALITPYTNIILSDINDNGHVSGIGTDSQGNRVGFLDINGAFTTIRHPDGTATNVVGINNNDDVVGEYFDIQGREHGFIDVKNSGVFTTLEVPGFANTEVSDINDQGTIVGDEWNYYYGGSNPIRDGSFIATVEQSPAASAASLSSQDVELAHAYNLLVQNLATYGAASLSSTMPAVSSHEALYPLLASAHH